MSFTFDVNRASTVGAFRTDMFALVEALIAAGWTVRGSGNGTSYENTGDTAGSTGTGSGGGFHVVTAESNFVWVRLGPPSDATFTHEYMFANDGISQGSWRCWLARGEGFTNGATASLGPTTPTATASVGLGNGDPQSTTEFPNWFPSSAGHSHIIIGDIDENYDWAMLNTRTSPEGGHSCMGQLFLNTPSATWGPDSDPLVYLFRTNYTASATNTTFFQINSWGDDDALDVALEAGVTNTLNYLGPTASYDIDDSAISERTYRVAAMQPCGHNGTSLVQMTTIGVKDGRSNIMRHFGPIMFAKIQGSITFIKGIYTGNLLKLSPTQGSEVLIHDNELNTVRRVILRGLVFPWDLTERFFNY